MEPLSTATAFATLVNLLWLFKAELRDSTPDVAQAFMEFLSANGYQELRERLEQNQTTTISIKALLNQRTEELLQKLSQLDQRMAAAASGVTDVEAIARALHPESILSPQAFSLLEQLEQKGAHGFIVSEAMGRDPELLVLGGSQGTLKYSERRFIEDDLRVLEELGFLRPDITSQGNAKFMMTRAASDLVRAHG